MATKAEKTQQDGVLRSSIEQRVHSLFKISSTHVLSHMNTASGLFGAITMYSIQSEIVLDLRASVSTLNLIRGSLNKFRSHVNLQHHELIFPIAHANKLLGFLSREYKMHSIRTICDNGGKRTVCSMYGSQGCIDLVEDVKDMMIRSLS